MGTHGKGASRALRKNIGWKCIVEPNKVILSNKIEMDTIGTATYYRYKDGYQIAVIVKYMEKIVELSFYKFGMEPTMNGEECWYIWSEQELDMPFASKCYSNIGDDSYRFWRFIKKLMPVKNGKKLVKRS